MAAIFPALLLPFYCGGDVQAVVGRQTFLITKTKLRHHQPCILIPPNGESAGNA